jgi:phosphonate transport system permease protein
LPRSKISKVWARNISALVAFSIILYWSGKGAKVNFIELFGPEGRANIWKFVAGLFPPELSPDFLLSLAAPALETIEMALLGVVLGAVLALPLAFLATRTLSSSQTPGVGLFSRYFLGHIPFVVARNVLNFMRTVPELVWALIFITAVGLGSFAGVLALAVHGAGLLGKLYSEAMEGVNPYPVEAVRALGGNRLKVATFAVLPQSFPSFVSLTLYQWECNIRTATILGFVGAGGIGSHIDIAMRLFQYNQVLTLMAVVFLMVFLVDNISSLARKAIISAS